MTLYKICHQSGRVLFTTHNEVTARNREQFGWKVIEVDKSREQFEKWFSDQGKHQYAIEKSNGNYILASANSAWQSWQASRAAIEIEYLTQQNLTGLTCPEHNRRSVRFAKR